MREILFRGKRISTGEWVEGGIRKAFHPNFDHEGKDDFLRQEPNCYCICTGGKDIFVDQSTIGQFTGLTDRNGKKIFEGDIIQSKAKGIKGEKIYSFVIKYGKYLPLEYCRAIYSQWQTIGFYAFDGKRDYQLSCFEDLLEVIGNIHDNKELVKGGAEG